VFEPQHDDAVEYVQDFHTLKNWISQSYGSPTSVQEIWLEKLYQYDQNLWGQAVMRGHLVMVAEWKNPGTDIVLVLNGGDDTVGLVADFASTTFVVPVSFDPQSQAENAEEVIEETTTQEALPAEPPVNPMVEEVSVEEMSLESEGSGEFHPETEVASQGPENQMQELEEIEQMLNEEYPLMEGGLMDSKMNEAVLEEAGIEADSETQAAVNTEVINPEFMEEHPMEEYPVDEQHLLDEGMNQKATEEQAAEVPPTDEHAMNEHSNDHAMEAEVELDPHHL
jgi:hypothetical protein